MASASTLDNSQMNPFSVGNWRTCTKTTGQRRQSVGCELIIKIFLGQGVRLAGKLWAWHPTGAACNGTIDWILLNFDLTIYTIHVRAGTTTTTNATPLAFSHRVSRRFGLAALFVLRPDTI